MSSTGKSFNSIYHRLGQFKKNHEPLIVSIGVGVKNQIKQIRIEDPHNMAKISQQIRQFIFHNNLKDNTFDELYAIIIDEIKNKNQDKSKQKSSHSASAKNGKCYPKKLNFNQKYKHTSTVISRKNSLNNKTLSKTPEKRCTPKHLQICLDTKISQFPIVKVKRGSQLQQFMFDNSFTVPSSICEKDEMFFSDQLEQNAFTIKKYDKQSEINPNCGGIKSSKDKILNRNIKKPSIKLKKLNHHCQDLSPNFKKQNINQQNYKDYTPKKNSCTYGLANQQEIENKQFSQKKKKIISTRQRKQAIITAKKITITESTSQNLALTNVENVQCRASPHKSNFKQVSCKSTKNILQQPFLNEKCISKDCEAMLQTLFKRLTKNNPSQLKLLNSQYVCYQKLALQQLHFMGVLFEKIDHTELNNLDYYNFRLNSLKYCWNQLDEMIFKKSAKQLKNMYCN